MNKKGLWVIFLLGFGSMRTLYRMCQNCLVGATGVAFLAQKESMKRIEKQKGSMEYYDRLG